MRIQSEVAEAEGLTGRVYKQYYVNNNDPKSPINRRHIERSLEAYWSVYKRNPEYLWHGINVVALVARAKRDPPDDIIEQMRKG